MSPACRYTQPVDDVSLKAGTDIAEGPGAGLARHEDGLGNVVKHLARPVQWPVFRLARPVQWPVFRSTVTCRRNSALAQASVGLSILLGLSSQLCLASRILWRVRWRRVRWGWEVWRHLWMVGKRAVCRKSWQTLFMYPSIRVVVRLGEAGVQVYRQCRGSTLLPGRVWKSPPPSQSRGGRAG